jgi:hypothetical protein
MRGGELVGCTTGSASSPRGHAAPDRPCLRCQPDNPARTEERCQAGSPRLLSTDAGGGRRETCATLRWDWGAAERGRGHEARAPSPILWASSPGHPGDSARDGKRRGAGVRGQRRTTARGQRGESEGAEESEAGKAVHTGSESRGEGPEPAERLEPRYPANAEAVRGESRGGWSKVQERFRALALAKDRRCGARCGASRTPGSQRRG